MSGRRSKVSLSQHKREARNLFLALDEGADAARSLQRIKDYSPAQVKDLAEQGDALREELLRRSAEAWARK